MNEPERELTEQPPSAARESAALGKELYDAREIWSWAHHQAAALERRDFGALDLPNLVEEIEYLACQKEDEWESECMLVIKHMLKIQYSPTGPAIGKWKRKIIESRCLMKRRLDRCPGMKSVLAEMAAFAWDFGRHSAISYFLHSQEPPNIVGLWRLRRGLEAAASHARPWSLEEYGGHDPTNMGDYGSGQPTDAAWSPEVEACLSRVQGEAYLDVVGDCQDLLSAALPRECPWSLEEIAGYDPRGEDPKAEPSEDVWPVEVAARFHRSLEQSGRTTVH